MSTARIKCQGGCDKYYEKERIIEINGKKYCPDCAKEKEERDEFSKYVCKVFLIQSPGPTLWSQRKNLIERQGFTHDQIMLTLRHIYEEEKMSRDIVSLGLIKSKYPQAKLEADKKKRQAARTAESAKALQNVQMFQAPVERDINSKLKQPDLLDPSLIFEE